MLFSNSFQQFLTLNPTISSAYSLFDSFCLLYHLREFFDLDGGEYVFWLACLMMLVKRYLHPVSSVFIRMKTTCR